MARFSGRYISFPTDIFTRQYVGPTDIGLLFQLVCLANVSEMRIRDGEDPIVLRRGDVFIVEGDRDIDLRPEILSRSLRWLDREGFIKCKSVGSSQLVSIVGFDEYIGGGQCGTSRT